jgi:hypothetical protein
MVYSQLNNAGCFLPVSDKFTGSIENQIAEFVSGNLRIAVRRIFEETKHGGLGLFRVEDFL